MEFNSGFKGLNPFPTIWKTPHLCYKACSVTNNNHTFWCGWCETQ